MIIYNANQGIQHILFPFQKKRDTKFLCETVIYIIDTKSVSFQGKESAQNDVPSKPFL